jgi:hypothetical protein
MGSRVVACSLALFAALFALGVLAPQSVAELPANGRAWELITQIPSSSSAGVVGMRPMLDDDERIVYAVAGPPPGTPAGAVLGHGIATRGPAGWTNTPIGFPYNIETTSEIRAFVPILPAAFSEDLRSVLWLSIVPLTPDAPPERPFNTGLYRESPEGQLEFIAAVGNVLPAIYTFLDFADISSDGSWVVFNADKHLLPADATRTAGSSSIYAWHDSHLQLVDVDNSGALLSPCGIGISDFHGMSASGTRVFFSDGPCESPVRLYLRDLQDQTTTEVSASQCTRPDCNAPAFVSFAGATPSGSVVYMMTTQQLTDDDEDSRRDLYAYDVETGELKLLSGGSTAAAGEVLEGIVVPSEIPGRVYFRATGELLPGESGTGEKLFLADGSGLHLVAAGPVAESVSELEIQLSANGSRALFVTSAQLLPEDTDSQEDAYLYDAEEETLTRISTGPSGGNGAFPVSITAPSPLNQFEFETGSARPYYAIDAGGDRAFFTTEESLLPEDTNGEFDVYEFWHGSVGLLTPGDEPYRSDFAGISRDGRSAMFATSATLTTEDRDSGSRDLYAARLGGGFPPQAESPGCDGASCPFPGQPRLARAAPPTTAAPARRKAALRLLSVATEAKNGAIVAVVSVPAPGRISGQIWIRGKHGKTVLARGSKRAAHSGRTRLALRLTKSADASAADIQTAHLAIHQGDAAVSRVVRVKLG